MPKRTDLHKILVIGSGPIVIGQAAEFDYAGSQACISLKEEGYQVVLVNSNPATIMTDDQIADQVYLEPLTVPSLTEIIELEHPDALLPTLGGQTGLNLAIELDQAGVLNKFGVTILGTDLQTIQEAEDREQFKQLMEEIGQPVPASLTVHTVEAACQFAEEAGYPVIVRPAFTLGGTGGGIANDQEELELIAKRGLAQSPVTECLIEQSIAGLKEIEFEVMRDANGDEISVCCMENFDPVGIHTGDSIVVAPNQTLPDVQYQRLRSAALAIVAALKIEGGCNVQLAQSPISDDYYVIEVNPRVSRSSALASKATGYPIAKIAAKIAVGLNLSEITNPVTQTTIAAFEPALDYVVVKLPRFPFDKFGGADRHLGTQMKAAGEVMGIGLTFEEALLKAIDSLEIDPGVQASLLPANDDQLSDQELVAALKSPTDLRLFELFVALKRGYSTADLAEWTKISPFFLHKLAHIWQLKRELVSQGGEVVVSAKRFGFTNAMLASALRCSLSTVEQLVKSAGLAPVYKTVDTCAGEFASATPYYYSSYFPGNNESQPLGNSVLVLGSGPIRIGQGVEFDYTTVHCVQAIQEAGYRAIIINNNPETVSTDFSISDKLYFEPLTIEHVMNVVNLEQPRGVIVQFGGQTAINLTKELVKRGVKILGTSLQGIEQTEDRHQFEELLKDAGIAQPKGATALNLAEAKVIAPVVGYPVMVRPSFVLGGRAMAVVENETELVTYVNKALKAAPNQPVLIDHYVAGLECEVDILSDGHDVLIPGIMEHLEGSGIHSGDSMALYPPVRLTSAQQKEIVRTAIAIGQRVHCLGMMNIQFIVADRVYVIEVNPRASRTVPFMSKVTGYHLAKLATRLILGETLVDLGLPSGLATPSNHFAVKAPVFSFAKLAGLTCRLAPEMKSTGETIGIDESPAVALAKALANSYGLVTPVKGQIVLLNPVAATDSKLRAQLEQAGLRVEVWASQQLPTLEHQRVWAVVNDDKAQTTIAPLNYYALINGVPLFTAATSLSEIMSLSRVGAPLVNL